MMARRVTHARKVELHSLWVWLRRPIPRPVKTLSALSLLGCWRWLTVIMKGDCTALPWRALRGAS